MNVVASLEELFFVVESQLQGKSSVMDDHIQIFDTQCIALADGTGMLPYGDVASAFACDTAIWCYKHVRLRPYYWEDKIKLLGRIFRTTNLSLWQKRKERMYADGLASTLCVALLGIRNIWIAGVGSSRSYLIREGVIVELIPPENQQSRIVPMVLGCVRSGIVPRFVTEKIISGDVVLLCSDGVSDFVTEDDLRMTYEIVGDTLESCQKAVRSLLELAKDRGSTENETVCLIKKR